MSFVTICCSWRCTSLFIESLCCPHCSELSDRDFAPGGVAGGHPHGFSWSRGLQSLNDNLHCPQKPSRHFKLWFFYHEQKTQQLFVFTHLHLLLLLLHKTHLTHWNRRVHFYPSWPSYTLVPMPSCLMTFNNRKGYIVHYIFFRLSDNKKCQFLKCCSVREGKERTCCTYMTWCYFFLLLFLSSCF